MTEWKKNLLTEFHLCTHLKICFFDRYDNLLYRCPQDDNESVQKEVYEIALKALEELGRVKESKVNFATVFFDKKSGLFCTACYFDESLPELGRIVFGPYTQDPKSIPDVPFLPYFAVNTTIDFLHTFVKEYSHKNEMYKLFNEPGNYHFMRIAQFIEANVNKNISLGMISENLNLSKPYICSIVKKATNYTVSQFVAKAKINQAKILFWNGFTDIHEVSLILGYKSQSYFSRKFKEVEGISPIAYVKSFNSDKKYKRYYQND